MKILFTGGGTAGHINPALALAEYIKKAMPTVEIRFAGAKDAIEEKLVTRAGYQLYSFPIAGLSRKLNFKGICQNAASLQKALSASLAAKKVLNEFEPDIVIGTGGYASFPAIRAATQSRKKGIKCAMLEVNSTPGIVVKKMASKVDCVFTSFEETAKLLPPDAKTMLTGSPVRAEIENIAKKSTPNVRPLVVSFWGSVGALYMNEKMADCLKLCAEENKFDIIHAAGTSNYKWMPEYIEKLGVKLENAPNVDLREYIYDMADVLSRADLVVCRAGAGALAEICACGKPSIIVPSPYVAENHQEKNARVLERAGACVVIIEKECTGELLYTRINELLSDRGLLEKMGNNAEKMHKSGASARIWNAIRAIVDQK